MRGPVTAGGAAPWRAGRSRAGEDRRLLGEMLLEAGLITTHGLAAGLEEQRRGGGRLGVHLIRGGHVVPAAFHLFLGEHLEAFAPDLVGDVRSGTAAGLLPARLAHHYGMVPVRAADGVLDLAVANVDRPGLRPAVEALTGLRVEPIIVPPSLLAEALGAHYPAEVEPGVLFLPSGDNLLILSDPSRGLRAAALDRLPPDAGSGAWLRAIAAQALRDGARRIDIAPRPGQVEITFVAGGGRRSAVGIPSGALPGIAALLEGLARIASRGRIVPRAGRFALRSGGERRFVSLTVLPGLGGRTCHLDLRAEQVGPPDAAAIGATLPGLAAAVDGLAERGRGLLGLAATGPSEWGTGLEVVLARLGDRLGRRAVIGAWDDRIAGGPPEAAALDGLRPGAGAELIVIAAPWRDGSAGWINALARDRVVLAALEAPDACAGGEVMARGLAGAASRQGPAGIVAARHLEAACVSCRTPFDLRDLIALLPAGSAAPAPAWTSPGCPECSGSGRIEMRRVAEFLPLAPGRLSRPGTRARSLREESPGRPTLFRGALRGALEGTIDAREVVRLLIHEPR